MRLKLKPVFLLAAAVFALFHYTWRWEFPTIVATGCPGFPDRDSYPLPLSEFRTVVMESGGVELVCSLLGHNVSVLEFGSGGSTTFFSEYSGPWLSVEHDPVWAQRVRGQLAILPWGDKVTLLSVPPKTPFEFGESDGTEEQFHEYLKTPGGLHKKWDLIIDDGRARVEVGRAVVRDKLLAPGGRMIIHDWEREEYKVLLEEGWRVEREDTLSTRHTAVLRLADTWLLKQ